jgi:hypothetical protein
MLKEKEENHMEAGSSSLWLIRVLACGAAGSYLVAGLSHFGMPVEQLHFAKGISELFFASLQKSSFWFRIHYWSFVVAALCSVGIVFLLSQRSQLSSPVVQLVTILAMAGFLITAIDFARMQATALRLADVFDQFPPEVRQSIVASGLSRLDPTGLFGLGLVGLWFAVINTAMLTSGNYPAGLTILGFGCACLYELGFLGSLLRIPTLIDVAIGLGGILVGPAWCLWMAFA